MANILNNIKDVFNRKKEQPIQKADTNNSEQPTTPVKKDCVERYTLVNPKNVMVSYDLWELCEKVPVAYEDGKNTSNFVKCVQMNTSVILPFIRALKKSPDQDIASTSKRTVSIIHLTPTRHVYILPILPILGQYKGDKCIMLFVDDKNKTNKLRFPRDWFLDMTPQLRQAFVQEIKVHTR